MNRKILRTKNGRFCEVEITLKDGRLSVCGTEGRIVSRASARREALDSWVNYFEDNPGEIIRLGRRTARGAAKYVLDVDGEYHGLDVLYTSTTRPSEVFLVESCGQIQDTIREFFPELAPLLPWHLNDMRAGCVHQEASETRPEIGAPCAVCGYKYGSAWNKVELPPEIVRLAETAGSAN